MGMFDSFRDDAGREWQTKAYDRALETFRRGDRVPELSGTTVTSYQLTVLGGRDRFLDSVYSLVTVRENVVVDVGVDDRDRTLPLIDYFGGEMPHGFDTPE